MSLNIKNAEAHKLAAELAALTGESMSVAVTKAMRERLARLRGGQDRRLDHLLAIARDCAAHLSNEARTVDHGELLYGDDGLPR